MVPPFSTEEFFAVFVPYNQTVWFIQLVLAGLALAAVMIALWRPA